MGSLSNSTWHVPKPEAIHANLGRAVGCFTGDEIRHSRETGPPKQPQREVRRPLAQSRPRRGASEIYKAVANLVFYLSLLRALHEHRPGHDCAQKFDRCIPVAATCLGLRGCTSHRRYPKNDSLFGGAGRNSRPLTAAPRGGRGPSLASLVALWCSLTLVRYSIFFNALFLDIYP